MAQDSSYVIHSGAAALDRLELIARLFWPTTQAFLRRHDALELDRFLDVGCGIGDVATRIGNAVGVDINAEVVDAARKRCRAMGSKATFRVAGLADLGADEELRGFDAVYARCVLSHQSDPHAGLAAMLSATRPGGMVLVEDVEVAAVWSSPPSPALARYNELYVAAARGLGARPDIGCELAVMLRDLGATDVRVELIQPMLRGREDLQAHARTMEAIAAPVIVRNRRITRSLRSSDQSGGCRDQELSRDMRGVCGVHTSSAVLPGTNPHRAHCSRPTNQRSAQRIGRPPAPRTRDDTGVTAGVRPLSCPDE
jgi:SAM-dependent methyltransferase